MKYVKSFKDFLNESEINEGTNRYNHELEKYVKAATKNDKVNFVTFEELLIPLAQHLDSYTGSSMGDLEYTKDVLNIFKKLVDGMAKSHIEGSSAD